jgi:hypothetical protein
MALAEGWAVCNSLNLELEVATCAAQAWPCREPPVFSMRAQQKGLCGTHCESCTDGAHRVVRSLEVDSGCWTAAGD